MGNMQKKVGRVSEATLSCSNNSRKN